MCRENPAEAIYRLSIISGHLQETQKLQEGRTGGSLGLIGLQPSQSVSLRFSEQLCLAVSCLSCDKQLRGESVCSAHCSRLQSAGKAKQQGLEADLPHHTHSLQQTANDFIESASVHLTPFHQGLPMKQQRYPNSGQSSPHLTQLRKSLIDTPTY